MAAPLRKQLRFVFTCIAVLVIALLYFFFDAATVPFFPRCPFHQLTGLYCPGCGSQRALSALLHGRFQQAASYNPLLLLSLPLLLYSAGIHTINTFTQTSVPQRMVHSPLFIRFCLITVILFFILRNLPGYPFEWLRPA